MKKTKIVYFGSTVLLSLMMLAAAFMELSFNPEAVATITGLGYPMYFITIIGVAKILGVIGIWQKQVAFLREWAYAGFFIDFIGALASHLAHGDGPEKYGAAVFALVLVTASYWSYRKLQGVQG